MSTEDFFTRSSMGECEYSSTLDYSGGKLSSSEELL